MPEIFYENLNTDVVVLLTFEIDVRTHQMSDINISIFEKQMQFLSNFCVSILHAMFVMKLFRRINSIVQSQRKRIVTAYNICTAIDDFV